MNFSKVDKFIESLNDAGIPSAELVIKVGDNKVYHKCVGYNDENKTVPTGKDDVYWLFSATKVITCIAAMQLVEAGLIGLDDPVSKYLPAYANLTVRDPDGTVRPAKTTMLIRHLFTMTGGLSYDIHTESIRLCPDRSTLGIVNAFTKDPLKFDPGTHYFYSLCHDVLGAVIEVVSGMKLSEYMKVKLFDPLGIKDMGFRPNPEQRARLAPMYTYLNGEGKSTRMPRPVCIFTLSEEYDSGGAGLFGTAEEYSKIISAISLGGTAKNGYRVLKKETVDMLKVNLLEGAPLEDFALTVRRYGYGFGLCGRAHMNTALSMGKSPLGEFGWDSAGGAYCLIDTDNQIAVFYMQHVTNCLYSYDKLHPQLRNLIYEAILED